MMGYREVEAEGGLHYEGGREAGMHYEVGSEGVNHVEGGNHGEGGNHKQRRRLPYISSNMTKENINYSNNFKIYGSPSCFERHLTRICFSNIPNF